MSGDEAILAALDSEPDAFAGFYRRHVAGLLDHFLSRTHDPRLAAALCAETFATALLRAHRFDPARGTAVDWLYEIAEAPLDKARRRGAVPDRARRRLGMAALAAGDGFVGELEEELVAAARFRATRRVGRPRLPRVPLRVTLAAAALAVLAFVAAVALDRGGGDRAVGGPGTAQPSGFVLPLAPMLAPVSCGGSDVRGESAAEAATELALLTEEKRRRDALPGRDAVTRLPVRTFDPAETRLADDPRLATRLHVVPSLGVSADGSCESDDGPGVCLVGPGGWFRCFPFAEVRAGHAFARAPGGLIVGVVPDDVGRLTLSARGRTVSARVFDNVYEAELDVPAGTDVRVEIADPDADDCQRGVAPELLERVATLRREPDQRVRLPPTALDAIGEWRLDAIVTDGARLWGAADGVDFWTVPVVAFGSRKCAPANRVCVVAVPAGAVSQAECMLHRPRDLEQWRFAPLFPDHAAIFGTVPDGVIGAQLSLGKLTAQVVARDNVFGGVLPFPYEDGVRVELIRRDVEP